jgi:hypothetical protein
MMLGVASPEPVRPVRRAPSIRRTMSVERPSFGSAWSVDFYFTSIAHTDESRPATPRRRRIGGREDRGTDTPANHELR